MKKLILILLLLPTLSLATEISADETIRGSDLIEMVRREGLQLNERFANQESYTATIKCTVDRLNSRLSFCEIK